MNYKLLAKNLFEAQSVRDKLENSRKKNQPKPLSLVEGCQRLEEVLMVPPDSRTEEQRHEIMTLLSVFSLFYKEKYFGD